MVCKRKQPRKRICKRLVIFLLFLSTFSYAQSPELSLDPETIYAGRSFRLDIITEYSDPRFIEIRTPDFPDKIRLRSGPSIRPRAVLEDGERVSRLEISYTFQALDPGRIGLGSFYISNAQNTVKTPEIIIEIRSERNDLVPLDADWQISAREVYQGQVVSLVLRLKNLTEIIAFPDAIDLNQPSGGLFEEVEGLGKIEKRTYSNGSLYSVPVASYLFTPTERGSIRIPEAVLRVGDISGKAASQSINVLEAPAEIESTGAIGTYDFSVRTDKDVIREGETLGLIMRVEGEGNLHYIQFPEIVTDRASQGESEEESSLTPVSSGYRGYRELRTRLIPERSGILEIRVGVFTWFDPSRSQIGSSPARQFRVEVQSEGERIEEGGQEKHEFRPMDPDQVRTSRPRNAYARPVFYLAFLPSLIILVVFLLKRRLTKSGIIFTALFVLLAAGSAEDFPKGLLANGIRDYEEGKYEAALGKFQMAGQRLEDNPGILYNEGLAYYMLNRPAESVHKIRKAIRINPMIGELKESLDIIEADFGLKQQVSPPVHIHPDLFFFALIVFFNLGILLLLLLFIKRGGIKVIFLILNILLIAASLTGMVLSIQAQSEEIVIIKESDSYLKKIPREDAGDWLSLQEGTAVEVMVQSGDFLLVRTAFDIEGWIAENAVYR